MTSFFGSPFTAPSPFWGLDPKDAFLSISSVSEIHEPSLPGMETSPSGPNLSFPVQMERIIETDEWVIQTQSLGCRGSEIPLEFFSRFFMIQTI